MPIRESGEDYLETIYLIKKKKGNVKSVDIADALHYSRPSVSRAVGILKTKGLVTMGKGGEIDMTPEGAKQAKKIFDKHVNLTAFFMATLGLDFKTAESDACKMEHTVSTKTLNAVKKYLKDHKKESLKKEVTEYHTVQIPQ